MARPLLRTECGGNRIYMKKIMAALLSIIILGMAAMPVAAQNPYRQYRGRTYQSRTYYDRGYYDNRTFWQKHRDKVTTAGGVLGGAILGSIIGGRKGAAIGALAGGGGAALYTYKVRPRRYYQRY